MNMNDLNSKTANEDKFQQTYLGRANNEDVSTAIRSSYENNRNSNEPNSALSRGIRDS
jgi:hypothetical protein